MVASIFRLRLAGLANAVRHPRHRTGVASLVLGVVAVLVALVVVIAFAVTAASLAPDARRAAVVVVGSVVLVASWVLPFAFGVDDALMPRAFAVFGIPHRRLAFGLALGGTVTVPALLLVVFVLAQAVLWVDHGILPVLAALVGGVLAAATAVLGARIASWLAAERLDGDGARSAVGLLGLTGLALAAPAFAVLAAVDWPAVGLTELRRWAAVLAWTPVGAAWAVPGDLQLGDVVGGLLRLLIAAIVVAALWLAWERIVAVAGSSAEPLDPVRRRAGIGLFAAFPATPTGALAARSLVYWLRDPRYSVPPLALPLVPAVLVAAFALAGVPAEVTVWLPVPILSLLIGWLVHNDVATDGTAFWLHVVTGIDGRADRWGRIVVPIALGLPIAVGGAIASAFIVDDPPIALPLAALSVAALGSALGVASAVSARSPYPAVAPGDGAFAQPQAQGDDLVARQGWNLLFAAVLCLPTAALIVLGLLADPVWLVWSVVVGLATAVGAVVVGVESGARVVAGAAPELLEFARSN